MANIQVQIEINKGVRGVPLDKLSRIVGDVQQFLAMLSEDVGLPATPTSWIGLDFKNSSLVFVAEKVEPVNLGELNKFNKTFISIAEKKPDPALRRATVAQYARIADPIDSEEAVSFELFEPPPLPREFDIVVKHRPPIMVALRRIELTKAEAEAIEAEVQAKIKAYGALQGRIHSLFLGSRPAYFNLRELSTGTLVKCVFKWEIYQEIAAALQRRDAVLHVYGHSTTDLVQRKLEEMEVKRIDLAPVLSSDDFDKLFGISANFTGRLTTQEFIDYARKRGN